MNTVESELAYITKSLHHPNIVQVVDIYNFDNAVVFVREVMEFPLSKFCSKNVKWTEVNISFVAAEVIHALAYLHLQNIVHAHFSSDHVFFNSKGEVKITTETTFEVLTTDAVPDRGVTAREVFFSSPELLLNAPINSKADIWSFGIVLLHAANGHVPNNDGIGGMGEQIQRIINNDAPGLEKPQRWSNLFRHFVKTSLEKDDKKRSSSSLLVRHPFVKSKPSTAKTLQDFIANLEAKA